LNNWRILSNRVDVTRVEQRLLHGLTGDELLGPASLLDRFDPLERLVEVIVDDKAHCQNIIVIDLLDHTNQLRF